MTPWPHIFTGIAAMLFAGGFATAIGAMIATIVNSPECENSTKGAGSAEQASPYDQ